MIGTLNSFGFNKTRNEQDKVNNIRTKMLILKNSDKQVVIVLVTTRPTNTISTKLHRAFIVLVA